MLRREHNIKMNSDNKKLKEEIAQLQVENAILKRLTGLMTCDDCLALYDPKEEHWCMVSCLHEHRNMNGGCSSCGDPSY